MIAPFDALDLLAIAAAYCIAGFAKGATGLGFSTICLPILAATIGLKAGMPLVILPSLVSNLVVMSGAGPITGAVRRFWPMLLAAPLGVAAGLFVLSAIEGDQAAGVLGAVLLAYCAFALRRPDVSLPARYEAPLGPLVGLSTGLVNGVTGSQVMPLLPFLMSLQLAPNLFLQAINLSFTLSSLTMAIGLSRLGLMTWESGVVSAFGVGLAFLSVRAGERMRKSLSPEAFKRAVLGILILMGIGLLLRAL